MMPKTVLLSIFAFAMLTCTPARAWVVLAFDEYAGATYLSHQMDSADQAEKQALKACRMPVSKAQCVVVTKALQGNALVVVKGINAVNGRSYVTSAVSQDPRVARGKGLDECQRDGNAHCTVVEAVWDPAENWSALARGEDVFHVVDNAKTAEAARVAALKGCEARTTQPGSCTIVGPSVSNAHAWVVFVESGHSKYYAHDADRAVAEAEGLEACRGTAMQPQNCHVVAYHENSGPQAEPATFAAIKEEARHGEAALQEARSRFNLLWLTRHPAVRGKTAVDARASSVYAGL